MKWFRRVHYAEQWELAYLKGQIEELRAQVVALKTYLGVVTNLNDRYRMEKRRPTNGGSK